MKKLLSVLFCLLMIGMTALPAFAEDTQTITEVRLSVTEPAVGEAPDMTIESAEPDKYTAKVRYWIKRLGGDSVETFEDGVEYALVFDVTSAAGYKFAAVEKNSSGFDESPAVVYINDTVTKNVTLTARFEKDVQQKQPKVIIRSFTASSKTYDYRASIEFAATVENPISRGQIHWFVDGKDVCTGDTYTAVNVKKSFTLQAKYYTGETEMQQAATEIETVNVNTGFFAKLKAFFRALFGRLPKEVQAYPDFEMLETILSL